MHLRGITLFIIMFVPVFQRVFASYIQGAFFAPCLAYGELHIVRTIIEVMVQT